MVISAVVKEENRPFAEQERLSPFPVNLLGELVSQTPQVTPQAYLPVEDGSTKEILFGENIGGVWYLLVRLIPKTISPDEVVTLSPREQEIARLIAKGLPNKVIATVLEISPWTVSTHLRRIFLKLNVNSRAEMVATLISRGLLENHRGGKDHMGG